MVFMNTLMNLSYLKGGQEISDQELLDLNISLSKLGSDSRGLNIPNESLESFKKLIRSKLSPGFWNEVISTDQVWFCFKSKDGLIQEFILNESNQQEIAELCSSFSGDSIEKTSDVISYIARNDFYTEFVDQHFQPKLEFGTRHEDSQYRKTVVGVLFNPDKSKILVLRWPIFPCAGLIVGGVEEGEDLETALAREVAEETGYKDFTIEKKLGKEIIAHYFADNKNVWRTAEMHCFLVQLNSLDQTSQKLELNEKFSLEWVNPEDYIQEVEKAEVNDKSDFRPFKYFVRRAQ